MVKTSSSDVQKGVWNEDGDAKMAAFAPKQHGTGNWTASSKRSGREIVMSEFLIFFFFCRV